MKHKDAYERICDELHLQRVTLSAARALFAGCGTISMEWFGEVYQFAEECLEDYGRAYSGHDPKAVLERAIEMYERANDEARRLIARLAVLRATEFRDRVDDLTADPCITFDRKALLAQLEAIETMASGDQPFDVERLIKLITGFSAILTALASGIECRVA